MYVKIIILCLSIILSNTAAFGGKFSSSYPCTDSVKTCLSSGTRIIDGFEVHRDCWEWAYVKTCNYPSKNDCKNYSHCYAVADLPCLLRDSYGNCVNLQKEFSCKRWEPAIINKEVMRTGLKEVDGKDKLVCKGVACIDGNCIDKSYLTDGDMMDSVSKLYMVSQMKDAVDLNFRIFAGFGAHCSKKAAQYTNCCSTSLKGWGTNLGAKCTKDEKDLVAKRQKNLCVYVGKENKQTMGVTTVVKHHWCCFGSLINKVIQVEGRKQLGINFGSGGRTDCRGLTLEEIMNLDFNKMDFSEFYADILKRMKIPNIGDISSRVNQSLPNVRKYDANASNKQNNATGWNSNLKDESWEAEEERNAELERLRLVHEEEKKRNIENAKLFEEERIAQAKQKEEEARLAKIRAEEERARKKLNKEQELQKAKAECKDATAEWNIWSNSKGRHMSHSDPEYIRQEEKCQDTWRKVGRLKQELRDGNY